MKDDLSSARARTPPPSVRHRRSFLVAGAVFGVSGFVSKASGIAASASPTVAIRPTRPLRHTVHVSRTEEVDGGTHAEISSTVTGSNGIARDYSAFSRTVTGADGAVNCTLSLHLPAQSAAGPALTGTLFVTAVKGAVVGTARRDLVTVVARMPDGRIVKHESTPVTVDLALHERLKQMALSDQIDYVTSHCACGEGTDEKR